MLGDGSNTDCPCFNLGATGHGCDNSSFTGGALLGSTGTASLAADTLVLTCTDERPTALTVFMQGVEIHRRTTATVCAARAGPEAFTEERRAGPRPLPRAPSLDLFLVGRPRNPISAFQSRFYQLSTATRARLPAEHVQRVERREGRWGP